LRLIQANTARTEYKNEEKGIKRKERKTPKTGTDRPNKNSQETKRGGGEKDQKAARDRIQVQTFREAKAPFWRKKKRGLVEELR